MCALFFGGGAGKTTTASGDVKSKGSVGDEMSPPSSPSLSSSLNASNLTDTPSSAGGGNESGKQQQQQHAASKLFSTSPSFASYMPNARDVINRYLFGIHYKTKRSLAEEAESGDEISVCSWVKDGVDPNELDSYGYTPLLNASALGRLNAVTELIKSGADVNKTGQFGFAPLHAAAQNGHSEVVAELLKHGANINAQNSDLDTPMHLALRSMNIEIVNMLQRHGADARIRGFHDQDCIKCARELGLNDLATVLENMEHITPHHNAHS